VSETIHLKPIGADRSQPIATQLILANNTEPLAASGRQNLSWKRQRTERIIVTGIGLSTGADNPRAVGCKWTAGPGSYMNDVKFIADTEA